MASINNYIESQYRKLADRINIEYIDLYQSFSNKKLQEIFSTIQHILIVNYSSMNSRLPTNEYGNHFWADKSRELILAIEVIEGLKRVLIHTVDAFVLDPYYEKIVKKSKEFLAESGGSTIPPHMDKIEIYYADPIIQKKDGISINSKFTEKRCTDLKEIGKGSYAKTYEFYDTFYNRKFVLKRANADLSQKEIERFRQEYEQMNRLHSPYIVEVYKFIKESNEYIMEYMDCTLSEYILNSNLKPTIDERKKIVCQVLKAFQYIHSKNLLHRDISPTNILIKKYDDVNVVKISDFGLVKVPTNDLTSVNTAFKGSFNDLSLEIDGFSTYSMIHETYALTKLILFIMTDSAILDGITDINLKAFAEKGMSIEKSKRYSSVDEMILEFNKLMKLLK